VPLKKWCCTNSDCDANLEWGECPARGDIPDSSKCPPGYTSVDNGVNCYRVYWESTTRKTWQDARSFCEKTPNTTLASVLDPLEQGYVALLAMAKTKGDAWIGLNRDTPNTPWTWADSRPNSYTNWGQLPGFNETNKCVYIQANSGKWSLASCDEQRPFICKYSTEPFKPIVTPPPGYCADAGWKEHGFKCYKAETLQRSYPEAKFNCIQQGMFQNRNFKQRFLIL
jgi:hypothetical protein